MRCFVAAWPDESAHLALAGLSEDIRRRIEHRRVTHVDDLHLTLAFIGDLSGDDAFAVAQAAARLRFKPFEWELDTLGFFEQAGVVWAGADIRNETGKPLLKLADRLRRVLNQMNVEYDRRPLAPHVTLLRGVKRFDMKHIAPPIPWRIDSIALYRSAGDRSGSRYSRVLR